VDRAVITGNVFAGPAQIANNSKGSVEIANNAARPARNRERGEGTSQGTAVTGGSPKVE
jgi:hypothetical protein